MFDSSDDEFSQSEDEGDKGTMFKEYDTYLLVAIDCHARMFAKQKLLDDLSGFEVAIKAAHTVADGLVLAKTTKNKIGIALFHPDPAKRVLIDFDDAFTKSFIHLEELAMKYDLAQHAAEFNRAHTKSDYNFAHFLIDCKKMLAKLKKADKKKLVFVTLNEDPCDGLETIKSQAIQEFQEMAHLGIHFDLLPLSDAFVYENFFEEVYTLMGKKISKFYYNLSFLTTKLQGEITYKTTYKRINFRLYSSKNDYETIPCLMQYVTHEEKFLPNKQLTRDFKAEVVSQVKSTHSGEQCYKLNIPAEETVEMSGSERAAIYKMNGMIGITLKGLTSKKLSNYGWNWSRFNLLRAKNDNALHFNTIWNFCVNQEVHMMCTIKYSSIGRTHNAELTPILINNCKYFHVLRMPTCLELSIPNTDVESDADTKLALIMDKLVDQATINDYDITKVRPYDYIKQVGYFKKELLGAAYTIKEDEFVSLMEGQVFDAEVMKMTNLLSQLFPGSVKRGKGATSAATKKKKIA